MCCYVILLSRRLFPFLGPGEPRDPLLFFISELALQSMKFNERYSDYFYINYLYINNFVLILFIEIKQRLQNKQNKQIYIFLYFYIKPN